MTTTKETWKAKRYHVMQFNSYGYSVSSRHNSREKALQKAKRMIREYPEINSRYEIWTLAGNWPAGTAPYGRYWLTCTDKIGDITP